VGARTTVAVERHLIAVVMFLGAFDDDPARANVDGKFDEIKINR
jgi:hypothetical protein